MRVLIAGSSGMVGSAVTRHLIDQGHDVVRLVRRTPGPGEVFWDPNAGVIDRAGLEHFDGVVHMASMPWPLRWTTTFKRQMRESRIRINHLLAESLARTRQKPPVLICASGMGFYPSSGEQILTEDSPAGTSFIANLQRDGEAAATPASEAGIRVVHLRIPPVIAKTSMLRGMNRVGDGRQWVSWIGREELASIVQYILKCDQLVGPVNTVSPKPLRNTDFAAIIARGLGRKSTPSMPAFLVRLLLGEMGEEFLLASRRIEPSRLLEVGYPFRFPDLEQALQYELGLQ